MIGYSARKDEAEGIHDRLKIKTTIFGNYSSKLVLISCDLLGLDFEYVREVRNYIEEEEGISAENIIIACTHTHSGPSSMTVHNSSHSREWLKVLKEDITHSVKIALGNMQPSLVDFKQDEISLSQNTEPDLEN